MDNLIVTLTGADDATSLDALLKLGERYSFAEWGLLFFPEKEGTPRNPSPSFRRKALDSCAGNFVGHICGETVYRSIIDEGARSPFIDELSGYRGVQININSGRKIFSDGEILSVYRTLLSSCPFVILQRHEKTVSAMDTFLNSLDDEELGRIRILLDESKGRGIPPSEWTPPVESKGRPVICGYAGGLSPENLPVHFPAISEVAGREFRIDMETGVRTDNEFDIEKARQVLEFVWSEIKP